MPVSSPGSVQRATPGAIAANVAFVVAHSTAGLHPAGYEAGVVAERGWQRERLASGSVSPARLDWISGLRAQQAWLSSVTELITERLPALSIAWTENVFELCVP